MKARKLLSTIVVVTALFSLSLATGCSGMLDGSTSGETDETRQGVTEDDTTCDNGDISDECEDGGDEDDGDGGEDDGDGGEDDGDGGEDDGDGGEDDDDGGEDDGDGGEDDGDGGEDDPRKAISFVAFCVESGSLSKSDITDITVTNSKNGGASERLAISWTSSTPIDRVVLKTGGGSLAMENFDAGGATSGTAAVGDGSARLSSQSPFSPCPDGESGVKFE